MPVPAAARRSHERGISLLEAMVSLSILLVGMLGLVHLQIYGITANGGARAHTVAMQLARELASGLAQLDPTDSRIAGDAASDGGAPSAFPSVLLSDGAIATGTNVHAYSDATAIPGTRLDATLERDASDATQPAFHRVWSVWNSSESPTGVATKIIAVSVIYRERGSPFPREVTVYAQVANLGLFGANVSAYN